LAGGIAGMYADLLDRMQDQQAQDVFNQILEHPHLIDEAIAMEAINGMGLPQRPSALNAPVPLGMLQYQGAEVGP
jgi:hypothetical protein